MGYTITIPTTIIRMVTLVNTEIPVYSCGDLQMMEIRDITI